MDYWYDNDRAGKLPYDSSAAFHPHPTSRSVTHSYHMLYNSLLIRQENMQKKTRNAVHKQILISVPTAEYRAGLLSFMHIFMRKCFIGLGWVGLTTQDWPFPFPVWFRSILTKNRSFVFPHFSFSTLTATFTSSLQPLGVVDASLDAIWWQQILSTQAPSYLGISLRRGEIRNAAMWSVMDGWQVITKYVDNRQFYKSCDFLYSKQCEQ